MLLQHLNLYEQSLSSVKNADALKHRKIYSKFVFKMSSLDNYYFYKYNFFFEKYYESNLDALNQWARQ